MAFCTKCGARLEEGQEHVCAAQAAFNPTQQASTVLTQIMSARPASNTQFDVNRVLELIKDPFKSLSLDIEKEFLVGILGVVASTVTVLLWILAEFHSIGGSFDQSWNSSDSQGLFAFILTALSLTVVPLLAFYIMPNWSGNKKHSFKSALALLGATQWLSALGFLIATLAVFISMKLAIVLLISTWITSVAIYGFVGYQIFEVPAQKQILVMFVSVMAAIVVTGLVGAKILSLIQWL